MSLAQDAASGVRWNAASMIAVTVLQTATLVVLGRVLDPSDFGLLAMMVLVTGFAGIFAAMGLGEALVQRTDSTREQLSSLYWANIGLGLVVYALIWIATPLVASMFGEPTLVRMLPVISLVFVIGSWGSQFRALLQKALHFRTLALINLVATGSGSATAVLLAIAGYGVWSLVWGQIINAAVGTLLLVTVAVRARWLPSLEFRLGPIKDYLSFGVFLLGSNAVNYLSSRSDQLVIGVVLGSQALGFYSMAFNLVVRPIMLINPVLTQVAFPVFARVQEDIERLKRGYLRMLRILASINGPLLIGFAAIAPIAIPFVLGNKWVPIIPLVQILAVYSFVRSMGNAGGSLVLAVGRARWSFYWNLALFGFIPVLVFAGAKAGGLLGVGWMLTMLQLALFFVWYGLLVQRLLGRCLSPYLSSVGIPAAFAAAMGVVVIGLSHFTTELPDYLAIGGLVGIGGMVYTGLYWALQRELLVDTVRLLFNRGAT